MPAETYIVERDPPVPVGEHGAEYPDPAEMTTTAPGPGYATPGAL